MTGRIFGRRSIAVAAAGWVTLSTIFCGAAAAQAPDVFVTVFAGHYVVEGRVLDDLGALERLVGPMRPGAVRLYACGDGTARAQMAAAYSFRDRYLELRLLDPSAPQCNSSLAGEPRALTVAQRSGEGPTGIDDEAVARWWYATMP